MATTIQNIELPKKPRARDTSGNNNHGEIYSGRGLEFDGVSDHLTGLPSPTSEMTVSLWVYASSSATGGLITWDESGGNHNYDFVLYRSSGKIAAKWDTDTLETTVTSNSSLLENTWYRVVVTQSSDTFSIYINGQLDISSSITAHLSGSRIGAVGRMYANTYVSENFFSGKMSDIQVWDAVWTQTDVTYDYLNPESLALNASGTALTEGNLKVWYPMQDGHRGQQSYILDGANTGLGDAEILLNADFSINEPAAGNAYLSGGLQFDNWVENQQSGLRKFTSIPGGVRCDILEQSSEKYHLRIYSDLLSLTEGQSYRFTAEVRCSLDGNFNAAIEALNGRDTQPYPDVPIAVTNSEFSLVNNTFNYTPDSDADSTVSNITAQIFPNFVLPAGSFYEVRNVSLKAINDKHHATTVFTGDDLWDLADNHTANWSTTGGATKAAIGGTTDGVKLTFGGTATNVNGSYIWLKDTSTNTLTEDLTVGRTYKLSGKFATDVAGATNAPRVLVYADGANYPSTATVPATNLVTNGTMEVDDNWVSWQDSSNERSNTQAHNGTYSRKFTPTSSDDGIMIKSADRFTTVTGTTYLVSFWIYPDDGTVCSVFNRKGGEASIGTRKDVTSLEQDAWNKVEMQFTEDVGGDDAYIGITSSTDDSGDFYVDDVVVTAFLDREITFTATHATTNNFYHFNCDYVAANEMIEQGSNANNSTFASNIGNWVVTDDSGGDATIAHSTADGGSITINPTTDDEVEGMLLPASYLTDLEVGRSYTVLVNMKSASGTPGVEVRLGNDAATAQNISTTATTYAFVVSPIVDTGALRVQTDSTDDINIIVYSCEVYPHCNLFVDDISFKEVGVASGWTDADQQLHIPQTALQSYNELAWNHGSGDVTVSALGAGFGTNDFAISYVIHPDDQVTTTTRFLALEATSSTGRVVHQLANDGELRLYIQDSDSTAVNFALATASGVLDPGQTYHVVESFDRTANLITTYINGVASGVTIDISTLDGNINCNGGVEFYTFSTDSARGFITEVALWKNTTLSATEALELYNDGKPLNALTHTKASTLYGYWRNNGLSTWKDLVGSKDSTTNTLTETILIPQGVDGSRDAQGFIMNKARNTSSLNFPVDKSLQTPSLDTGSYVEVGDHSGLTFGTGNFSMECWVKPSYRSKGSSSLNTIFTLGGQINDSDSAGLCTSSGSILAYIGGVSMSEGYSSNNWYHVVATREGLGSGEMKLYVNGAEEATGTSVNGTGKSTNINNAHNITIGAEDNRTRGYEEAVDSIKVYNAALSASEVLQNYNATKRDHTN